MKNHPTVIKGGTLIDGTGKSPIKNSMIVISGSKILDVGTVGEVDVPDNAQIMEVNGKTVIPSFIDSHTHFILMGVRTLSTIDLSKTNSISEIVDQVKKRVAELPNDSWIIGHGWDESNWDEKRYPTKEDLDPISPNNPVVLTPYYGHLMVVNSRTLELAKVTKETSDPPGGKIDRNSVNNEATGILREEAMDLIEKVKPPMTEEMALAGIEKACKIVLNNGCASIHELESDALNIRVYQTAYEKGLLKIRAYVMPEARFTESMLDGLEVLGVRTQFGNDFLKIGSVKIYTDGSMGSRTAVFFDSYADDPSTRGIFAIPPEELKKRVLRAHKLGMQVAIHAIGDKAIDEAINAIETALLQEPKKDHRHRIEHCELVNENQIQRIKQLGIVTSMQPNFVGEWGNFGGMYEQRLGSQRFKLHNPFRKLIDEGIPLAFGSDCGYCPPWPFNPIFGVWSAVNHPIRENQISLVEAIKCYTLNGAYASFEENIKGSIEPGKLADITILSEDLSLISPMHLLDVKVEMTIVNGKIQYKAKK